ncbi:MAG: metal-dependent hydrolase [Paracoccus sp. (in: a-proteobacteria)]|nr:metal-dependent hydrolase [Paracoccus sp. (in: a-proteobacteria)]
MKLVWLGHGSWRIEIAQAVLLIDPWLAGNPSFPDDRRAEAIAGATHILLTHGHGDHASEIVELAGELSVPVIGIYDLMSFWEDRHGITVTGMNKGGTVELGGAKVTMVNACHSSSFAGSEGPIYAGAEAGFMIAGEGRVIYFSGDTDIMADMGWMGQYHKPDIGILSCGGHFTMDMDRAAFAAEKFFDFKVVLPSHYKTFPLLAQDAAPLARALPGICVIAPEVLEEVTP